MKHLVITALFIAILSSCHTKRGIVTDRHFAQELSMSLKMDLSPKDNLLLYAVVNEWIGVPYRMGGETKKGTDCSNLMRNIERRVYGRNLARSTEDMYKSGIRKLPRRKLKEGDLVFFATGKSRNQVNHVGVYLKRGNFVHASTSKGVMISHLDETYFLHTWISGGKVK